MAQFFFNSVIGTNAGTGTSASPFNQKGFDAAIAAGTFRVGGADEIRVAAGSLVISAVNADSTLITNISGTNTVVLNETVLDGVLDIDLTGITAVSGTISLVNNNAGSTFGVNSLATLRLNAAQASGLAILGSGSVVVSNLQTTADAQFSGISTSSFTAFADLTTAVTFTGDIGAAALTLRAASAQTFTVDSSGGLGSTELMGVGGSITVADNVTLITKAGSIEDLSGRTLTTSGTGQIVLTDLADATNGGATIDLSKITGDVVSNITGSVTLNDHINFGTIQPSIGDGVTLTLSGNAANNVSSTQFNGAGSFKYDSNSASGETVKIFSTGSNEFKGDNQHQDNSVLTGGGADTIVTGNGNNFVTSGAGKDIISTGSGNNVIRSGSGADSITLGTGFDFVEAGGGNDTIEGGDGAVPSYITDSAGNDKIDLVNTNTAADTILSGSGADTIVSQGGNDFIGAGSGADNVNSGDGADSVVGGGGNDTVVAGTGNDTVVAGAGADVITGGVGADDLDGGADADIFIVGTGTEQVASDKIAGGTGTNTIRLTGDGAGTVTAVEAAFDFDNISDVLLIANSTTVGDLNDPRTLTFSPIAETTTQTVTVNAASSTAGVNITNNAASSTTSFSITSGSAQDELHGSLGGDTLSGGDNDDILEGYAGADSLSGGAGLDTFKVGGIGAQTAADTIVGGDGADEIHFVGNSAVIAEIDFDNVSSVAKLLNGVPSGGNRSITFSPIAEATVQEISVDFKSTASTSSVVINNNAASSTTTFNILGGNVGDTLNGSNGNDTLNGDLGDDLLVGGAGNDTFAIKAGAADRTLEQTFNDSISGGTGTDKIVITGGANIIKAKFDMDNISDVLTIETSGTGTADKHVEVEFAQTTETTAQTVVINAASLGATTDLVMGAVGGALLNNSASATTKFNITGGGGTDILVGSNGADTITGGAGTIADTIYGGAGVDVLTGGAGSDDFSFIGMVGAGGTLGVDVIKDYTIAQTDELVEFSHGNLELLAAVSDIVDVKDGDSVGNTAALAVTAASNTGAALDLTGLADTKGFLLVSTNYASAAAFQADVRANVTAPAAFDAGDAFFAAYDNGVNTTVALVSTAAGLGAKGLLADAVVTPIITLEGLGDAGTITDNTLGSMVA